MRFDWAHLPLSCRCPLLPESMMLTRSFGIVSPNIAGGRMRAFLPASLIALLVGGVPITGAAAHDGWFVRVCPANTEANHIHLSFSGAPQGVSWSWIKGRTPDEIGPSPPLSVRRTANDARRHELDTKQHSAARLCLCRVP
jgi:hypothetical protein